MSDNTSASDNSAGDAATSEELVVAASSATADKAFTSASPAITDKPFASASSATKDKPFTSSSSATADKPFTSANSTAPMPKPKPKSRSGSAFVLLLDVLLLVAVVALGFGYWQQKRALDTLTTEHAALVNQVGNSSGQFRTLQDSQQQTDSSLQAMQQQIEESLQRQEQGQQQAQQQLQTQLGESSSRIAGLAAQLNSVNSELAVTRQQVNQLGSRTADDVMLSEAASLVELAQQRLLTARDAKSATTLLVGSDDLLAKIASIDVTAARTVLAADMTNLKAVPAVNVEALYQQLAQVRSQVSVMSVVSGSDNPEFVVPQSGEVAPPESGWFDNALSVLGEYFVVTRQDVDVVPLLTTEQQFLIRQNIELQLTSAQLALVNAEPEVYRSAVAAASDGINRWLQSADDSKTKAIATLNTLRDASIVASMPDISASLNAIRQIVPLASIPATSTSEVAQ
ncbi:MAG: uroporphyrinogen-III C-methyltransferase [Pseudomonadota bacterium]